MLRSPTPPSFQVVPDEIEYDQAFQRGGDSWFLIIQGFVGTVSEEGAQRRLDRWLASSGSESVKEAVESDRTLGGVADSSRVTRSSGYRLYTLPQAGGQLVEVLGAEWSIQVETSG